MYVRPGDPKSYYTTGRLMSQVLRTSRKERLLLEGLLPSGERDSCLSRGLQQSNGLRLAVRKTPKEKEKDQTKQGVLLVGALVSSQNLRFFDSFTLAWAFVFAAAVMSSPIRDQQANIHTLA